MYWLGLLSSATLPVKSPFPILGHLSGQLNVVAGLNGLDEKQSSRNKQNIYCIHFQIVDLQIYLKNKS